jgi:hypothetical protein
MEKTPRPGRFSILKQQLFTFLMHHKLILSARKKPLFDSLGTFFENMSNQTNLF